MPEALSDVPAAILWAVVIAAVGALVAGLREWSYRAARDRLGEDFVRSEKDNDVIRESDIGAFAQDADLRQLRQQVKQDLDGIGGRVEGLIGMHTRLNDRMERAEQEIGGLRSANEHGLEPLAKRFDEFQKRQEERDRQLAETLGNLRGTLDTFIREHRNNGRN